MRVRGEAVIDGGLAGSPRDGWRLFFVAVVAVVALVAIRNAFVYPAIAGYDAREALDYAQGLAHGGHLPHATGSYYTPPGFFAVGAGGIRLAEWLGLDHPERIGQLVNALTAPLTAILLLLLVREIWPSRRVLHAAALAFFVACPVVFKASAMFHPEPLALLFSAAALVLATRVLMGRSHALLTAVALGTALGLAQLVRAWTIETVGAIFLVLFLAILLRPHERRALVQALVVSAVVAIAVPLPWYVHQISSTGSPVFDRPQPEVPLWDRRPVEFYVSLGLPKVITDPVAPASRNHFASVAYDEIWGDYFGVWRWNSSGGPPSHSEHEDLVTQSIVGVPYTVLAVIGWLALLIAFARHPRDELPRAVLGFLPLAALVGVVYFATAYPTTDGDTAKGSFMLIAVPAWAACFGFAFDGMVRRFPRLLYPLAVVFLVCALVSLQFSFAESSP